MRGGIRHPGRLTLGTAALLLVSAGPVAAGEPYVSLGLGYSAPATFDVINAVDGTEPFVSAADFAPGLGAYVAAGLALRGFRVEVEASYRGHEADTLEVTDLRQPAGSQTSEVAASGDVRILGLFGNGYMDFPLTDRGLIAHLGFGVGMGFVTTDQVRVEETGQLLADGSHTSPGYQVMAGVDYEVAENTFLGLQYRFVYFTDLTDALVSDQAGIEDAWLHNLDLTLRYHF